MQALITKCKKTPLNKRSRFYRNLNRKKPSFSQQLYNREKKSWLVEEVFSDPHILYDCEFRVSVAGAKTAYEEQERNVHAFLYAFDKVVSPEIKHRTDLIPVSYKPFDNDPYFRVDGQIIKYAEKVFLIDGKCFIEKVAF